MSHARNRLRALGLGLIAMLGLAAFITGGAQAQWLVNGSTLTGHADVEVKYHFKGEFFFTTLLGGGGGYRIRCEKVNLTEGLLLGTELTKEPSEPNIGHVTLRFEECRSFLGEELLPNYCWPEPMVAKTLVSPILHNGVTKLLFEPSPEEGEVFMKMKISNPQECPLTLSGSIKGSLLTSCLREEPLTLLLCSQAQKHQLLMQFNGLEAFRLKYGIHSVVLTSVLDMFTVSPKEGPLPFAVHAP